MTGHAAAADATGAHTGPFGPDWYRRSIERIDDVVLAIATDGTIMYANPAVHRLFGLTPDEAVGRNCIELVHPDDLERALDNLAYGVAAKRVEVPVRFRLRGADGDWEVFELRGRGAGDEADDHMLAIVRETDGAELIDDLLDALATGAPMYDVHRLVARQLVRRLWANQAAVRYGEPSSGISVAHTGIGNELAEMLATGVDQPWTHALERGEMVAVLDPDGLKPELAAAMAVAGFASVVTVPVGAEGTAERACLVSFGPRDLKPNLGFGVAIDRCRRLLRLALQHGAHRDLLERSARTDPLTGIANRTRFLHQLDGVLARLAGDPALVVSVAFVDLDGFKPVNDRHGHLVGDRVLQVVADRLHQLVLPDGVAARFGGDEFALVAVGRDASVLTEAVRASVREPIASEATGPLRVSASVGAVDAVPSDSTGALLEVVDALCNRDKQLRRARR